MLFVVVIDTKKMCEKKKANANLANVQLDGHDIWANMLCVEEKATKKPSVSAPIFVPANAIATQNVFEKRKYFDGQDCSTSNVSFPPIEPAIVNTVFISSPQTKWRGRLSWLIPGRAGLLNRGTFDT